MKIIKNIKQIATDVLINESFALKKITEYLDDDFEASVKEIMNCKGRVVITGIGKSAIVATKIVATLNSTGTRALFMHAADAIHGDLGMITTDDIVICISKSGNSPEIKVLIPLIKRLGVKIIALVSHIESFLAQHANYVLNATIAEEACPYNLAPTTSTTVHMALGDALAVCLLQLRGFSSQDFARVHPGGSLGKRLYLKVEDIYVNNELPVVSVEMGTEDVIMEITAKRLGAAAVTDPDGQLCGIITDGDLRRMLATQPQWQLLKAKDIMGNKPKTLDKGAYAVEALELMQQNNITQIIVMNKNKIAGFVHLHDLLKEGIV